MTYMSLGLLKYAIAKVFEIFYFSSKIWKRPYAVVYNLLQMYNYVLNGVLFSKEKRS